jgi:hypothetical protein
MRHLVRAIKPMRCELCGGTMKLVRHLPAAGGDLSMALYQCERCRHTVVKAVEEDAERS